MRISATSEIRPIYLFNCCIFRVDMPIYCKLKIIICPVMLHHKPREALQSQPEYHQEINEGPGEEVTTCARDVGGLVEDVGCC